MDKQGQKGAAANSISCKSMERSYGKAEAARRKDGRSRKAILWQDIVVKLRHFHRILTICLILTCYSSSN